MHLLVECDLLLVECDPQYGIHRLVKQITSRSSRLLRQELPQPNPGSQPGGPTRTFVATIGGATLEAVKRYVENQRNA